MNNLVEGLNISVIGITTTFAALVLIQFVIRALSRLCRSESSAPSAQPQQKTVSSLDVPGEDVAAIMAVLASMGVSPQARINVKQR